MKTNLILLCMIFMGTFSATVSDEFYISKNPSIPFKLPKNEIEINGETNLPKENEDIEELHLNFEIDLIIEDQFQIFISSKTKNKIKEVEIFDILGNELFKNTKFNTTETHIELKKPLKSGVYYAIVKTSKCYNVVKFSYMK